MKKFLALTLSCLVICATFLGFQMGVLKPQTVSAEVQTNPIYVSEDFSICITGEATTSVTPDIAIIYASIETLDMDMNKSKDLNFEAFDKVVAALKELGIEKEDIIFEGFSSYPNYDYTSGKTMTGYHSVTSYSVHVDDLNSIKKVVDTMTTNGTTNIRNINYEISNLDSIYEEVLSSALENAKLKAEKLTQKTDLKIVNIKEEAVYSSTSLYKTYSEALQNNSLIGQLDIKARVTVKFSWLNFDFSWLGAN